MKRRMIEIRRPRWWCSSNSSKFQYPAFCDVCPVSRMDTVISDNGLAAEYRAALADLELETILVDAAVSSISVRHLASSNSRQILTEINQRQRPASVAPGGPNGEAQTSRYIRRNLMAVTAGLLALTATAVVAAGQDGGSSWRHFQEERWRIDEAGIKSALEPAGYTYVSADAQADPQKQLTDIESLIAARRRRADHPGAGLQGDPAGDRAGQGRGHPGHRL